MIIRKCISVEKECLEKLEPIVEKHNQNFSAAFREIVDIIDIIQKEYGKIDKEEIKTAVGHRSFRDNYIEEGQGVLMAYSIYNWFLKGLIGVVPPPQVLNELGLAEKFRIDFEDIQNWEKNANHIFDFLGLPVKVRVDEDKETPGVVVVNIRGLNQSINQFSAMVLSSHVAETDSHYKIVAIKEFSTSINLAYQLGGTFEEAYNSVISHFGQNQGLFEEIWGKPSFWRNIVNSYETGNYNMVLLTKDEFENILSEEQGGKTWGDQIINKVGEDASPQQFLDQFKEAVLSAGVVDEIKYSDGLIEVSHSYKNKKAIKKIERWLHSFMEKSGTKFQSVYSNGKITFKSQSDIDVELDGVLSPQNGADGLRKIDGFGLLPIGKLSSHMKYEISRIDSEV